MLLHPREHYIINFIVYLHGSRDYNDDNNNMFTKAIEI